jgi:acetate kinase
MRLTPLEGVTMGTRAGSADPAIIGHMANALGVPGSGALDIVGGAREQSSA